MEGTFSSNENDIKANQIYKKQEIQLTNRPDLSENELAVLKCQFRHTFN